MSVRSGRGPANHPEKNGHKFGGPRKGVRDENGFLQLKCENCFETYPWKGSGQRVFCPDCEPHFPEAINHAAEQERAREVEPMNTAPLTAESIIEQWLRQG
jgi:hypothetical protein